MSVLLWLLWRGAAVAWWLLLKSLSELNLLLELDESDELLEPDY